MLLEDRDRARHEPSTAHRPANLRPGEIELWRNEFQIGEEGLELPEDPLPEGLLDSLRAPDAPVQPDPPSPPTRQRDIDPGILIPEDILKEAQALLEEQGSDRPVDTLQVDGNVPPPESESASSRDFKSDVDIPDTLIEEAEAMLRKWLDGEDGS